jgi:beta-phosphoglucomutase-like phosphatase (HAD superfamily)
LLAAERLRTASIRCLALEDSKPGCQAASAAGMKVIGVPESHSLGQDFSCADSVMTSLFDVIGRLDELLSELRQE